MKEFWRLLKRWKWTKIVKIKISYVQCFCFSFVFFSATKQEKEKKMQRGGVTRTLEESIALCFDSWWEGLVWYIYIWKEKDRESDEWDLFVQKCLVACAFLDLPYCVWVKKSFVIWALTFWVQVIQCLVRLKDFFFFLVELVRHLLFGPLIFGVQVIGGLGPTWNFFFFFFYFSLFSCSSQKGSDSLGLTSLLTTPILMTWTLMWWLGLTW